MLSTHLVCDNLHFHHNLSPCPKLMSSSSPRPLSLLKVRPHSSDPTQPNFTTAHTTRHPTRRRLLWMTWKVNHFSVHTGTNFRGNVTRLYLSGCLPPWIAAASRFRSITRHLDTISLNISMREGGLLRSKNCQKTLRYAVNRGWWLQHHYWTELLWSDSGIGRGRLMGCSALL